MRFGLLRDPAGRFSVLKTVTLLLVLCPGAELALAWHADALGPRPITEVIHGTGEWAIRFLVITLAVTPARALLDWPRVVMLRRVLGVTAACYAVAHLTLYALDQQWNFLHVAREIALRFYLTIGFVALLGLLALAFTSTDGWQRRLGPRWKRLHKLVFPIGVLGLLHYGIQAKADISDMVFLAGLFLWLLFWRALPRRWRAKLWPLPGLALGAGLAAAVLEAGWYTVRNGIDGFQVLAANLDFSFGPRPAMAAGLVGLLLVALVLLRRLGKRLFRAKPATRPAPQRA